MWNDLSPVWHSCLEEAWQAYCAGTVPIGAVITGPQGEIIARGRNHIFDDLAAPGQVSRNQLAHAELNALLQFRRDLINAHECAIFTTMEPCPLCMGAIYMSGIRTIHFAARDTYAGSTNLLGTTPYLRVKPIGIFRPQNPVLEAVLISIITEFDLRRYSNHDHRDQSPVIKAWENTVPKGVQLGKKLLQNQTLQDFCSKQVPVQNVMDYLAGLLAKDA